MSSMEMSYTKQDRNWSLYSHFEYALSNISNLDMHAFTWLDTKNTQRKLSENINKSLKIFGKFLYKLKKVPTTAVIRTVTSTPKTEGRHSIHWTTHAFAISAVVWKGIIIDTRHIGDYM